MNRVYYALHFSVWHACPLSPATGCYSPEVHRGFLAHFVLFSMLHGSVALDFLPIKVLCCQSPVLLLNCS
jgi:hypothetical protein